METISHRLSMTVSSSDNQSPTTIARDWRQWRRTFVMQRLLDRSLSSGPTATTSVTLSNDKRQRRALSNDRPRRCTRSRWQRTWSRSCLTINCARQHGSALRWRSVWRTYYRLCQETSALASTGAGMIVTMTTQIRDDGLLQVTFLVSCSVVSRIYLIHMMLSPVHIY